MTINNQTRHGLAICLNCHLHPDHCNELVSGKSEARQYKKMPNCLISAGYWAGYTVKEAETIYLMGLKQSDPASYHGRLMALKRRRESLARFGIK